MDFISLLIEEEFFYYTTMLISTLISRIVDHNYLPKYVFFSFSFSSSSSKLDIQSIGSHIVYMHMYCFWFTQFNQAKNMKLTNSHIDYIIRF